MVFASDKQRMGFFARVKALKTQHDQKVAMKLEASIKMEQREATKLSAELKTQIATETLRAAKEQQLLNQRKQLADLRTASATARAESEKFTNKGKAKAILRELVDREKAGFQRIGRGIKTVATSKTTKKALSKIRKGLGRL